MSPTLSDPEVLVLPPDGGFPNAVLPVLIHRAAIGDADLASAFERRFAVNGWTESWRDGVYDYHHFHSTAHEVLGIAKGNIDLALGGPSGRTVHLEAGDVVVLPAGVSHCRDNASPDLLVVGAYDRGRACDMRHGDPAELDKVLANIAAVPLPERDPVHGEDGPLVMAWSQPGR